MNPDAAGNLSVVSGSGRGLRLSRGHLLLPDRLLHLHPELRHRPADRQVDDRGLHALLLGIHRRPVPPLLRHAGNLHIKLFSSRKSCNVILSGFYWMIRADARRGPRRRRCGSVVDRQMRLLDPGIAHICS